jgi:hypothetical protein
LSCTGECLRSVAFPKDLYFAPFIAGYHGSPTEHWSFGLYVYAPTAKYEKGRLANEGLNVWTVTPAIGSTKLFSKGTVEFYSPNPDTDYKSGQIFRLDLLLMKRFGSGWGFGGRAGGWIQQIGSDDGGVVTERLDRFKGRAFGLGPTVTYTYKLDPKSQIDFSARWVLEFGVEKRFGGNGLQFGVGLNF